MLHFLTILLFTLVIDAGHGGKDPGAVGKHAQEKDINLAVAKTLAEQVRQNLPQIKVLLTRSDDRFLTLQERANFVNSNNADLFICIHTNSAENKAVTGAETFVLGTEKMDKNLDVAMRENSVMKLEADYQTTYQGFDPTSVESYIMFSLLQNAYTERSLTFASLVQHRFANSLARGDRGVRQAAFWVLLKSACPSVLVELGFISNPTEEAYLSSDEGKAALSNALYQAISVYYSSTTTRASSPVASSPSESVQSSANSSGASETSATSSNNSKSSDTSKSSGTSQSSATTSGTSQSSATTSPESAPRFAVQIFVTSAPLPDGDSAFRGLTDCAYVRVGNKYKYYSAPSSTRQQAVAARDRLRVLFPDCFVIAL